MKKFGRCLLASMFVSMVSLLNLPAPAAEPAAMKVNGKQVAQGRIETSVPAGHSASETFDAGVDVGSPVALDYLDRAPFEFNSKIEKIDIKYID